MATKDATEEAMSAIQEALKVRDAEMQSAPARMSRPTKSTDPEMRPDPAARAGRIPSLSSSDDDLFSEVRIGDGEPRRPANDDWKSMGQILQSLQPRASRTGYIAAAIGSLVWVILVGVFASSALPDLRATENLGLASLALASTFLLPALFFFVLAHIISRSREMRFVAQSMAEVAMRLGEPEAVARESIVTVGQAIRREVAAMGDGVERALARAGELETLVHNEVSALERAYSDNEMRIRGLLEDLNRQHDNLVNSAGQVRNAIKGVHLDLSQDITSVSDLVAARVNKAATEITQTLADKGNHITQTLAQTGDTMINALGERGGDLLRRLESASFETQTAIAQASEQLSGSLNFKTDHIPQEFEMLAENLTQMMQLRLADLTNDFARRATNVVDQMAERSEDVTRGYLDTSSRLAEAIAVRGDEVNNTIKATGESLVLDLSLRGGDVATRLEQTAEKITESLVSRSNAAVDAFNKNAEMLAMSVSARSDAVRDMLTSRLQGFEEMFTRGGAELSEKIGHDSATLGNLITKNLAEFDRTVKTYGGELVERLGERTDKITQAMSSHIDNFDGRVTAKVDEITGTLDQRLEKFNEAFDSRSQTLTDAMSNRVMDIARTLAEGGKEVVSALDTRIDEVGGTLDKQITHFEELLVGRAEKLTEQVETRTRAAAGVLDVSNETIRSSTENLERMLMTVSAGVSEALKQNASEVERTLLGVSAEVSRSFVGKADEISSAVSTRAAEMTRILDSSSSTLLSSLTSKSQEFTTEVSRATQEAVSAIEAKGFDFTRTMLDNSGELARLINEASESATGKVSDTLQSLQSAAREVIDQTQATTSAAVSEMIETHNMLRTDTTSLFERLRDANILLQEVMSGSQENMGRLEIALTNRVSEFATVMNDVTARTGDATNLVSGQVEAFQGITSKVVEDLSNLALQFDTHGRVLVQAVELIDVSNRKADTSIDERRTNLDSLIATLDIKSEELEHRLQRFSTLLDESLENSANRARDISRVIAETSSQGTQTIVEQFDLVRNSAEQERKRTKDAMQTMYEQAMGDTHAVFRQSTERFADVLQGIKQMAAEMQTELDATRAELRKGIMEMPQETAETTAQMRRVIVDQIEALAELNRIVGRHGRGPTEPRRAQEPALTVIGGGRSSPRPVARQNLSQDLPEPPAPPRARRAMPSEAPPIAPAPGKQGTGWLSDVLQRASRDEGGGEPRTDDRQARHSIVSLDALSVDIARMIDHDAATELWDRYNRGERNVFTRRLYTLQGQQAFDEIRKRYRADREFKQTVDRYIAEFEWLLEDVSRDDRGQVVTRTYLTSETGKVYTMLAHAAGRFD